MSCSVLQAFLKCQAVRGKGEQAVPVAHRHAPCGGTHGTDSVRPRQQPLIQGMVTNPGVQTGVDPVWVECSWKCPPATLWRQSELRDL